MMIIPGIHSFYANQLATMFTKEKQQQFALQPSSFWVHGNVPFLCDELYQQQQQKIISKHSADHLFSPSFLKKPNQPQNNRQYYIWMELLLQRYSALIAKIISPPGRKSVEKIGLLDAVPSCSINNFRSKKRVGDFRKAVTYERNAYCLFTLRKRWRLKASVPSGNTPSTGFHRFPGK